VWQILGCSEFGRVELIRLKRPFLAAKNEEFSNQDERMMTSGKRGSRQRKAKPDKDKCI
jgi:hypothetical protein